MTDEIVDGRGSPEEIDTGEPIRLLRDLEEPTGALFMGALHRRIQRRMLATDVTRLTWNGPILLLIEFLNMVFGLLGSPESAERPDQARGEDDGND